MEADAADVLLRAELLWAVHLLTLNLQFQTSPLPQLDDVASTEMTADNIGEPPFGSPPETPAGKEILVPANPAFKPCTPTENRTRN